MNATTPTLPPLAGSCGNVAREGAAPGYSIFISYIYEDEPLTNALTQQLKELQRQGLIAPWDDRYIYAGDEAQQHPNGRARAT